jgi:Uma2 family endonuclease
LVVEIKSQSDRIKPLQEKVQLFLALGAQVGLLIDPEQLTVSVYRPNIELLVLNNTDTLKIPELLPGWKIPVTEIWPPVFE